MQIVAQLLLRFYSVAQCIDNNSLVRKTRSVNNPSEGLDNLLKTRGIRIE